MAYAIQVGSFVLDDTANGIIVSDVFDTHIPQHRLDLKSLARRHGAKLVTNQFQPKLITLQGVIYGNSVNDLNLKIDAFKQNCVGSNLNLDINDGTYNKRYIVATNGPFEITKDTGAIVHAKFTLNYIAYDPPYGLDATQGAAAVTTTTGISALALTTDSNTYTATLLGSAPPQVKGKFVVNTAGTLTDIELVDINAGRTLRVTSTYANTDVLVIDAENRKVQKNDLDVDFTGQFPTLVAGSNKVGVNFYTSTGQILDQSQTQSNGNYPLAISANKYAQSFTPSGTGPLNRFAVILSIVGTGGSGLNYYIQTDAAGVPSGTTLTNGTGSILTTNINTTPNWFNVAPSPAPLVTAATKYWIVFVPIGTDLDNYIQIGTLYPQTYTAGSFVVATGAGAYTTQTSKGLAFKTYKATVGESNQTADVDSFSEAFTGTTYKDGVATTANWDTVGDKLILGT